MELKTFNSDPRIDFVRLILQLETDFELSPKRLNQNKEFIPNMKMSIILFLIQQEEIFSLIFLEKEKVLGFKRKENIVQNIERIIFLERKSLLSKKFLKESSRLFGMKSDLTVRTFQSLKLEKII